MMVRLAWRRPKRDSQHVHCRIIRVKRFLESRTRIGARVRDDHFRAPRPLEHDGNVRDVTAGEADELRIALKRSFRIVVFGGCNMRVLRQSSYIESSARPRECHLKLGGCHGNKKESRAQNQSEAQENPVTKTATPTKTKTAGYERVTASRPSVNRPDALPCLDTRRSVSRRSTLRTWPGIVPRYTTGYTATDWRWTIAGRIAIRRPARTHHGARNAPDRVYTPRVKERTTCSWAGQREAEPLSSSR